MYSIFTNNGLDMSMFCRATLIFDCLARHLREFISLALLPLLLIYQSIRFKYRSNVNLIEDGL